MVVIMEDVGDMVTETKTVYQPSHVGNKVASHFTARTHS